MHKYNRLWIAIGMILSFALLGAQTVRVQGYQLRSANLSDQEQIKVTVQTYFETRYRSLSASTLKMRDLSSLVDETPQGKSFLRSEQDKLEIEIDHTKHFRLGYVDYKYFLDFKDISIDAETQTALVTVIEGHDVVFEVSQLISPEKPIISSMRNLQHRILLRKRESIWKIVYDDYEDYLWRLIKATGLTKDLYLRSANESQVIMNTEIGNFEPTYECNLQEDNSTYSYNRQDAAEYANEWALGRNPDYFDFSDPLLYGGDCTNFISQAIYEGGGALMASDSRPTYGWYY